MNYSPRQKLGAVLYDLPRLMWSLRPFGQPRWVQMRNRDERLLMKGDGVLCDWEWTSDLHISNVFPFLGQALMRRALRDWPIELSIEPKTRSEQPDISFIIGHRGLERLGHLILTLKSIAAQQNASVECVVVEQSATSELKRHIPSWVRYIHTPPSDQDTPYCRSWAFNVGAREARGKVLVLHDNDMLVPRDYSAQILLHRQNGFDVINLKRFIFYLGEAHSKEVLANRRSIPRAVPQAVVQNLEAGGSVAISRGEYFAIGGFDEAFVGWGGEDNEFWQRAQTLRVWPYGYLPIVHLWHPAQPGKHVQGHSTAALFETRSVIPVSQRVKELVTRQFGGHLSHFVNDPQRASHQKCAE